MVQFFPAVFPYFQYQEMGFAPLQALGTVCGSVRQGQYLACGQMATRHVSLVMQRGCLEGFFTTRPNPVMVFVQSLNEDCLLALLIDHVCDGSFDVVGASVVVL